MRKYRPILFILFFCMRAGVSSELSYYDFDVFMGRDTSVWKNIKTKEDFENYHLFKGVYEECKQLLPHTQVIPFRIHFIWLGEESLPPSFQKNMLSWMSPNYVSEIILWVDKKHDDLPNVIRQEVVGSTPFLIENRLLQSLKSNEERKDLIRYLILYHKGGITTDLSYRMGQSIYPLISPYDFFCSLDVPSVSFASSSITPSPAIIGCAEGHPILKACLALSEQNSGDVEKYYPGEDNLQALYRIQYRTRVPFQQAVMRHMTSRSVVFPAGFFNQLDGQFGIYAKQTKAAELSSFQKKLSSAEQKFKIMKWRTQLYDAILVALNCVSLGLLALILKRQLRRKRQRVE